MMIKDIEINCAEREGADDAQVDTDELDREASRTSEDEISAEDEVIGDAIARHLTSGARRSRRARRGFIELRRVHRHGGGRPPLRKGHRPGQIAGPTVVVANHETSEAADRMTDGERGSCRRERRHERHSPAVQHPQSGADTANQPAEPAQTAAAEEQIGNRLLSCKTRSSTAASPRPGHL